MRPFIPTYVFIRNEILKYEGEKSAEDEAEVEAEPKMHDELRLGPPGPPFGIVINGSSLVSQL